MRTRSLFAVLACAWLMIAGACGDDATNTPPMDMGPDGPDQPAVEEVTCEQLGPVPSGTCQVSGTGAAKLIKGEVLTPTTLFHGGGVAIDAAGLITCVGCDCEAADQQIISCPQAAISPGLINTHDHITFTQNNPYNDTGKRYDDRQQWRKGLDDKPKISSSGGASGDQIRWGELRFLMGGATSIVGSGGQPGLLRNLDSANQEGLNQKAVNFDTFPLDDSGGNRRTGDCNYGGDPTTAASIANIDSYEPHTSEGINASARNEFLCQSSTDYDTTTPGTSNNLVISKTAMIHAIGLKPEDYGAMAAGGTAMIWSPRSNITLYGDTARVTTAAAMGVEIALGTDWMPTGSMNLLRELACADSFNQTYLNNYFDDRDLWMMVTANAAAVTATDDVIGLLAPGKVADIAVFALNGKAPYRSVIEAEPKDVALVLRGGKVLYGDDGAVSSLDADCDPVDVCTVQKRVCLTDEVGKSYATLKSAVGANMYPAFSCGVPENEPTCTPMRPTATAESTIFTGMTSATDNDGDGIANDADNCPDVFNPVRPLDQGEQGDADADSTGDACDPCPLDANSTSCSAIDPNDRDHDGATNAIDNCPDLANPDQADTDGDDKGDVCDACPTDTNPGSAGCPATIYAIKDGTVPVGAQVRVENALVTGKGSNGFFVQTKMGDPGYMGSDYSGLFVYTGSNMTLLANAVAGNRVTIDGTVAVFIGQTELDAVTAVTVTATGDALPAPVTASYDEVRTGGTRALTLESVLVSLPGASVTAVNTMFGEVTLTAGSTMLTMDDFLYVPMPAITVGQSYTGITGILTLRQGSSKLEPRSAADLVGGTPGLTSLGTTPAGAAFARVGVTNNTPTFPAPLTVTLSGPAPAPTVVTIMSMETDKLTVTDVTVPMGSSTALVPVTAVAADTEVTVVATLGVQMATATVRVLGAAEAPATVTLSPDESVVAAAGTATLTATLDVPALTPATVNLSITAGATLSAPTVTIPAGQVSATFTVTDTAGGGTVTVTASFGGSSDTATVTVSTGAQHLVINEVDYDQVNDDTAEFIEIFNPSAVAQPLTNIQVVLVNGSGAMAYDTINLGTGTLAPGAYLVIAGANVTVAGPNATKLDPAPGWTQDEIQNGAPDGIVLIDSVNHTVIDALAYEGTGSLIDVDLPGFPAPVSLVEGASLPGTVLDVNNGAGSLCRSPNGKDTNQAASDWKFCTASSPGAANP